MRHRVTYTGCGRPPASLPTLLCLTLMLPSQASANTAAAGIEETLEEIIVTSRKREENLMDIPDSISVFSDREVQTANITGIQDFASLTPNLTIIDQLRPGTQTMTIRGMTTVQNGELPVAFVVDGVNVPSMNFINQELIDIERIEVLRGPQGTLYGRGAVGGAISIITKSPTNEWELQAKSTYGRGNAFFLGGTVSGPLVEDKTFFRLSASHRDEDGLIDNVGAGTEADPVDEQSVQARLIYNPNDNLSFDLRGRHMQGEAGGIYLVPVTTQQFDDFSIPVSSNINGEDDRDITSTSLRVDYTFDSGITLTSISAYSKTDQFFFGDGDFSTAPVFAQDWEIEVEAVNEELRLTSDEGSELRWILGAFFQDREDKNFTNFGDEGPGPSVIAFPGGNREIIERRSWAVFGQADYDISERLSLSAGLRYDEEANDTQTRQVGLDQSETFDEWQPKLSVSYRWRGDVMTYVTLARGFRPGGFSSSSGVLYNNEKSDNFEVGLKGTFLDSRLTLSAALYYIDFSDQQHFFSRVTPNGIQQFIINIAETTNKGVEIELNTKIAPGLDASFSFGSTDSEMEDFDGSGIFDGNTTPQVNDFTFNTSIRYTRAVAGDWQFAGRLDYERRGEVNWDLNNLVKTPEKNYLNLYAAIENSRWTLFAFGDNILDEQQATASGTDVFGPGQHLRTPSRPRAYGVGVKVDY